MVSNNHHIKSNKNAHFSSPVSSKQVSFLQKSIHEINKHVNKTSFSSGSSSILGATLIVKIGEVRLSDEIGGGVKDFKKTELYNYY